MKDIYQISMVIRRQKQIIFDLNSFRLVRSRLCQHIANNNNIEKGERKLISQDEDRQIDRQIDKQIINNQERVSERSEREREREKERKKQDYIQIKKRGRDIQFYIKIIKFLYYLIKKYRNFRIMSRKNPQIYITNFSSRTTEEDLNYEFKRFGKIQDINMKRSYAFITYHDHHDAEDAVRKMDKTTLNGKTIVVEPAGLKKTRSRGPQPDDKCYSCGRRGHWANECEEKKRRQTQQLIFHQYQVNHLFNIKIQKILEQKQLSLEIQKQNKKKQQKKTLQKQPFQLQKQQQPQKQISLRLQVFFQVKVRFSFQIQIIQVKGEQVQVKITFQGQKLRKQIQQILRNICEVLTTYNQTVLQEIQKVYKKQLKKRYLMDLSCSFIYPSLLYVSSHLFFNLQKLQKRLFQIVFLSNCLLYHSILLFYMIQSISNSSNYSFLKYFLFNKYQKNKIKKTNSLNSIYFNFGFKIQEEFLQIKYKKIILQNLNLESIIGQ
ncbi:RNA recognition motif protein (macronuclear) [Tetrahymena thermophila SB210]|uniref:RNA recognition motif protein n=1 Tax=Tetrahymena thermophila (strain SB210) TaxID=312017 RepID=Q23TZ2_TETTS|nr:RNA recognition motif protein [Tetrahymena thermophila SB210]EAR99989.2 RNA recognition motif protein [Tetrahymena thermophila SB210]|eukprot:XP_001020234.2 RNA recognition motif protein [Tetrahymena thermophila SB210]